MVKYVQHTVPDMVQYGTVCWYSMLVFLPVCHTTIAQRGDISYLL